MEYIFEAIILIRVQSELNYEDAIDDFETNCNYNFPSTELVEVIDTQWEETN